MNDLWKTSRLDALNDLSMILYYLLNYFIARKAKTNFILYVMLYVYIYDNISLI